MGHSKNKSSIRLPLEVRLKYFFLPYRKFTEFVIFALIVIAASTISVLINASFPLVTSVFKDPGFVGLFGVLLGAVIGGYISRYLQLQQFRAETLIRKKQEIYQPLYEALRNTKEQLENYPYPPDFEVDPDKPFRKNTPLFGEWTKIKGDSRFTQVPSWITEAFNQYVEHIETYPRLFEEAAEAMHTKFVEILRRDFQQGIPAAHGDRDSMLRAIILGYSDSSAWAYYLNREIDHKVDRHKIIEECSRLEPVKKVVSFYQESIFDYTDSLILELARIIRFIEIRYENQDNLF